MNHPSAFVRQSRLPAEGDSTASCKADKNFAKAFLLICGIAFSLIMATRAPAVTVDNFVARTYTNDSGILPYRLFIPTNYVATNKYPIVLFLHGAGERGSDNRRQLTNQPAPLVFADTVNQNQNPSFMVAPQCPVDGSWSDSIRPYQVNELMNALMAEFSVDADRVYITGLSMGGNGTWDYTIRYPQKYAAAIPMSGGWITSLAGEIIHLPIWNFHGAGDESVSQSRSMVAAVRQAGGNVVYTEYAGGGHNIWTEAYSTPILMSWLYSQKRGAISSASPVLRISNPTDQQAFSLNGTNLALSGWFYAPNQGVSRVDWTNATLPSAGIAPIATTNWSVAKVVVNTAATNRVIITGSSTRLNGVLGGATTFNDSLAIVVPPSIVGGPASLAVAEGETAVFNVILPDYVFSPRYQWLYQGQPMSGATNSSLSISNAQLTQAGNYAVAVSNTFGMATSSNAVLTVNPGSNVQFFGPVILGDDFVVRFAGVPGSTYTIESGPTVSGPWVKAANFAAPATDEGFGVGVFQFSEAVIDNSARFYRAIYPAY
jgi:poly(3-hydroxybutyrate) depolymerase